MKIEHEPGSKRFAADVEGGPAVLEYTEPREGVLDLVHTFVPPERREQGIGEALVEAALAHARSNGLKVIPSCPFVKAWIAANPGNEELLA